MLSPPLELVRFACKELLNRMLDDSYQLITPEIIRLSEMCHRLILGEVILCPQLSFLFLALGSKVTLPAWTEVNVPAPELA
jgi:hypothetical protein